MPIVSELGDHVSGIFKAFRENEKSLRRYVARFAKRASDIDDFVQETFLKGFAAEMKGDIKHPKAFLFRVAHNLAVGDAIKTSRRGTVLLEETDDNDVLIDESVSRTDEWLHNRRKLALFAEAVASLPPRCQKAFLLRRVDGLSYKQIANRMDISVSAVEKHVATGLVRCTRYLVEKGYSTDEGRVVKSDSYAESGFVDDKIASTKHGSTDSVVAKNDDE